jgi:hypothetical protein
MGCCGVLHNTQNSPSRHSRCTIPYYQPSSSCPNALVEELPTAFQQKFPQNKTYHLHTISLKRTTIQEYAKRSYMSLQDNTTATKRVLFYAPNIEYTSTLNVELYRAK